MKTITLSDFFKETNYNWKKDKEKIKHICYYSKTRVDPSVKKFKMNFGMEQPFVLKSIADYFQSKNFLEIGTGRGTACYSIAMSKSIEEIHTLDLLGFKDKRVVAVGYKKEILSNQDIYKRINVVEKNKIRFYTRKKFTRNKIKEYPDFFDLCFIDGEHEKEKIILSDFRVCEHVMKEDAIIVFDDYCQNKFGVKKVVDTLLQENKDLNAFLIEFRGHLFDASKKEKNEGIVVISRRNLI